MIGGDVDTSDKFIGGDTNTGDKFMAGDNDTCGQGVWGIYQMRLFMAVRIELSAALSDFGGPEISPVWFEVVLAASWASNQGDAPFHGGSSGTIDKDFAGVVDTGKLLIAGVVDTADKHSFANISANFRKNSKRP